ncbi:MAG: aminopeptidase [Firmicutes bacterium]|nr:aminopeptidase [Bacillota bacterium]
MRDPRLEHLAKTLLNYSVEAKKGEVVSIQGPLDTKPLMLELVKEINRIGAIPRVSIIDPDISRLNMLGMDDARLAKNVTWSTDIYSDSECSIRIGASNNDYSSVDVPQETLTRFSKAMRPVQDIMLHKKWVLLNYPTPAQAQKAKMNNEDFFDYVIDVSAVDYSRMNNAFEPLKTLMEKTDKVQLIGPGTDLTFRIKGISAIPCAGEFNIPDGEIFTAPIKDSVNGTIQYNTPSPQRGDVYNNVKLTFKDGKIIEATCDGDNEKLNQIFDTDEGARYIGEFAIGVNPLITKPMGNILFDEKISGSIHFTPGMCYDEASNGNVSALHWDLVWIQTPEFGGGEIYFDDILIRKDGLFVIPELLGLNPENLK